MNSLVEEHYDAFGALTAAVRSHGELSLHFGVAEEDLPPDYCWFKALSCPDTHPEWVAGLRRRTARLQEILVAPLSRQGPCFRVLDVGCGWGATLDYCKSSFPQHEYVGVNIHRSQAQFAREFLDGRASIVEGDFLTVSTGEPFDFVYFLESGFHFPSKLELAKVLARSLRPGGVARFADIVISERMSGVLTSAGGAGELFRFDVLSTWEEIFASQGLVLREKEDLSRGVARNLQMSRNFSDLEAEYFLPALASHTDPARALTVLRDIHARYKRLQSLLCRAQLNYVILEFQRVR